MCPLTARSASLTFEKVAAVQDEHETHEQYHQQLRDLRDRPTPWSLYILPFSAMTLIYTGVSVTNVLTSETAEVRLGVWGWCETMGDGEYCIAGRAILGYSWRDAFGRLPAIGVMGTLKELTAVCKGPAFLKMLGPLVLASFVGHMMTFYFATSALCAQRKMLRFARTSALSKALQHRSCYHSLLGIALFSAVLASILSWTSFGLLMSLQDKVGMILSLHKQAPSFAALNTVTTQAVLGQGGWFLMICAVTSTLPLVTIALHFGLDALEANEENVMLKEDEDVMTPSETLHLIDAWETPATSPK